VNNMEERVYKVYTDPIYTAKVGDIVSTNKRKDLTRTDSMYEIRAIKESGDIYPWATIYSLEGIHIGDYLLAPDATFSCIVWKKRITSWKNKIMEE